MIVIREMRGSEKSMVLSDWKRDVVSNASRSRWSKGLQQGDLFDLLNYVIDRITLPSSTVYCGDHPEEPGVPLAWAAVRLRQDSTIEREIMYMYVRTQDRDKVLTDALRGALLAEIGKLGPLSSRIRHFNPFQELRR